MPKMRTCRSLAKRIKVTAKGKLKRRRAGKSHLLTKKRSTNKMDMRRADFISKPDREKIYKLLPYR